MTRYVERLRDLPATLRGALSPTVPAAAAPLAPRNEITIQDAEKELMIRALKDCGGNRTLAAKKIGMSRRTLHRKLHTYHLEGF